MSTIFLDTWRMRDYANHAVALSRRLQTMQKCVDNLHWQTGLPELGITVANQQALAKVAQYCEETATEFEIREHRLAATLTWYSGGGVGVGGFVSGRNSAEQAGGWSAFSSEAKPGSIEGSILKWEQGVEGGWGSAKVSAKFGTAEAHAKFNTEFFGVDEYGNIILPNVGVSVGGSVSLITLEAEGQVGNDALGAHAAGEINVLKAEAEARLQMGLVNEDGKFDPSLGGSVSTAAVLAEAKGTVGMDIAGADVNVEGKVQVGVGVQAQAEFNDGVLALSVGAMLGIGGSVKVEVDLNGVGDFVNDSKKNLDNFAQDTGKNLDLAWNYVCTKAAPVKDFIGTVGSFLGF
jgi:hypothetical protein